MERREYPIPFQKALDRKEKKKRNNFSIMRARNQGYYDSQVMICRDFSRLGSYVLGCFIT
jgi:hypothetical protein